MPVWLRASTVLPLVALVAACSSGAASPDAVAPDWQAVELPAPAGRTVHLRDVACTADSWWLAGSTSADGARAPGLWRATVAGADLVPVESASFYGKLAELTSVDVGGDQVVAVGSASGGAHGNPRPATWTFDGESLRENSAAFELYAGPNAVSMGSVATGPFGAVVVGAWRGADGLVDGTVWVAGNGTDFARVDGDPALASAPNEQVRLLDVAAVDDGVVAVGDRRANANRDGQVWTSSSGQVWERAQSAGLVGPADVTLHAVAADVDGQPVVAGTVKDGEVVRLGVWSPDGGAWRGGAVDAEVAGTQATSVATMVADLGASRILVAGRLDDRLVLLAGQLGRRWREVELPDGVAVGDHVELRGCVTDDRLVLVVTDAAVGMTSAVWVTDRTSAENAADS